MDKERQARQEALADLTLLMSLQKRYNRYLRLIERIEKFEGGIHPDREVTENGIAEIERMIEAAIPCAVLPESIEGTGIGLTPF